jgi:hypothetical protein
VYFWLKDSQGRSSATERDGILGTGAGAQTARTARIGVRGIGNLHAVHTELQLLQWMEALIVGTIDASNSKHILRTHPNAIAFTFTPPEIDHWSNGSRFLRAGGRRHFTAVHASGRSYFGGFIDV